MKKVLILAAMSALGTSAAVAQTTAAPTPKQPTDMQSDSATGAAKTSPRQHITDELKQAGFSNIRVVPDSFLVQAKDKAGDPISMMINPNSVTEVVASDVATSGQTSSKAAEFPRLQPGDRMSSKVVGLDVHNNSNQDVGTIKDIAYSSGKIRAYVVDVGGFLGMGDHNVAVSPSAIHITYDAKAKTWHAEMNATAAQLKAAPEFTYSNQA